ncbi:MAG: hypothetical protein H7Y00_04755, partial [Fimbriimonadaceae bacterium]|nr:hypothetical protein [Chitinophagales bacterium]
NFKAEFFGSVLQASITLNNWLETIFISGPENKPPLNISGNISCDKFDLQKTIATFTSPEKQPAPASPGTITTKKQAANDWMNVSGNIRCAIDDFQYKKLQVKNVKADLKLSPGFIGVNNFTGNSMNGNFNVQTTFRKLASENYLLEIIGILNTIDIQQLFIQLNNFEQTTLTDKNLSGKATAYIENVSIQWDKNYKLIEKNMYALVNVKIENGELINYKPLESLSKFVNIEDLKHIRFSTLQNQIEIKDRVITIPAMDIQTSALDIYVSGTHSFDNTIDYQMQLSLAELMAKKFFGKNKNKDNYENDTQGGINIYVSMTGTVEKPVIQYNKKQVKEKMQDQGIDKPDFLDIFKPDDPKEKHDLFKPKDNKHETDEDEPIEFIEWEDE